MCIPAPRPRGAFGFRPLNRLCLRPCCRAWILQVTVLSLMFTIPNMNTDDFRNAIQNLFKENLATAAGLPIENVRIKEVKAGSVVVDVDVVFPGEDAGRANALVQKMSDSTNSVFKSDVFGAVTAVRWADGVALIRFPLLHAY